MTRALAPLVIAMLVQGLVFVVLIDLESDRTWLVLMVFPVVALTALLWALRLHRRALKPLTELINRLSVIAPGTGSQPPAPNASEIERAVFDVHQRVGATFAETRRLRDEAEEAGIYKTAFLRAVAHELRTPLNSILGFTDILLSGLEGPLTPDRTENLEVIARAGRRLLLLFNDAIDLSAMASGQLSVRRARVDLREVLGEVLEGMEERLGLRPVHVSLACHSATLFVSGQRERLARVLEILGNYAVGKTESGAVTFVAVQDDEQVRVQVASSALDLNAVEAASLFSPEHAGDSDARRDGLRLAIARQLAELHGGALAYERELDGGRLVLCLPLMAAVSSQAAPSVSSAGAAPHRNDS